MAIYIIIILLFIVALFIIAIRFKNATLDKILFYKDEKTLFEEEEAKCKVYFFGHKNRINIYPNCKVILTTHRLITAQKAWLKKSQYNIVHIVNHNQNLSTETSFKTGYITYNTDIKNFIIQENVVLQVTIPSTHFAIKTSQKLIFELEKTWEIENILKRIKNK